MAEKVGHVKIATIVGAMHRLSAVVESTVHAQGIGALAREIRVHARVTIVPRTSTTSRTEATGNLNCHHLQAAVIVEGTDEIKVEVMITVIGS